MNWRNYIMTVNNKELQRLHGKLKPIRKAEIMIDIKDYPEDERFSRAMDIMTNAELIESTNMSDRRFRKIDSSTDPFIQKIIKLVQMIL